MKKFLLVLLLFLPVTTFAADVVLPETQIMCPTLVADKSPPAGCNTVTNGLQCYEPCMVCMPLSSFANEYHVVVTQEQGLGVMGYTENGDGTCVRNCGCQPSGIKTYSCDSNYYGSPSSETSTACKVCPPNATCTGGATFTCNDGYEKSADGTACVQECAVGTYFNGSTCVDCPDNALCAGSTSTFTCAAGYYKNSTATACTPCPVHVSGKQTSNPSSVSVTSCHIPADATWKDSKGTKKYLNQCNYSNL